jgi:pyruvate formate lyase activating enzyme
MNASTEQRKGALLYAELGGRKLRCLACARRCQIRRGARGYCNVRTNSNGRLLLRNYGRVVTAHIDTIEKKPAYHYRPGSKLLSLGTVGCNWSCDFCLNACISQTDEITGEKLNPHDLVGLAKRYGCQGIAYTYNEPLIFLEFAMDTGILAHQEGLFNVVVTNGYGTPETVKALSEFADCVTVGLKANASQAFLRKHSDIRTLKPIFRTLLDLKRRANVHVEISDLILGQGGDSQTKARTLCRWIHKEMGPDTPLHFVRFNPSHRMKEAQPTASTVLQTHHKIAEEAGLRYVYIANVPGHERENTFCPNCGKMVVGRFGYEVRTWNLDEENRCKNCGHGIPIVGGLIETPPEERYAPVVFPPMDMLYVCEGLSG